MPLRRWLARLRKKEKQDYQRNGNSLKNRSGWFGRGKRAENQFAASRKVTSQVRDYESVNDFGGTRTSRPRFMQGGGGVFGSLPKRTQRELRLDDRQFVNASVEDLIDVLADAHPDVSHALWNFLRLIVGDYTIKVYRVGSDKPFTSGEKDITELLQRLEMPNPERFEMSRSFNKVLNQLAQSIIMRGAGALELVLTPGMDDVAFLAPVDPATVEFYFENDRYVPYQDDRRISLDVPTFFYEGLDERIDDPYGRSPFLGALHMVMFQLQILNDVRAVVHNQGYPRLDITVLEEVLLKRMPIAIRNNEQEKQKWLNDKLNEIIEMYNNLEPDDTFVHYDSVKVDMVGGGHKGAIIDPEKLMKAIDNLIMSGLKTLSTILGRRSAGQNEATAKMEVKLFIKGVEDVQKVIERIISKALTLYLNIRGKQGIVKFKFAPVEIRTALEQAQFEQIALQNYAYMRDQGWIDQDEASMRAVGKPAVAEPNYEALRASQRKNKDGSNIRSTPDEQDTREVDQESSDS